MIPVETVGNPDLECEYLTSRIMSGIINNPEYLNLRLGFASLSYIDASSKISALLDKIKALVVDTFGLVNKPIVNDFYYGEAPELKSLVSRLSKEVDLLTEVYSIAIPQKLAEVASGMAMGIESAPMTFEDVGEQVNKYQAEQDHIQQLESSLTDLRKMQGALQAILKAYSKKHSKLTTKTLNAGLNPQYKIFLSELTSNLEIATDSILVSVCAGKCLDSVSSITPKDDLDPYLTDIANNFIDVMVDPKSFYTKFKNDEIVSSAVGDLFFHCYPTFFSKYQDMVMEDYGSMDYQDQIDFRKYFGLGADDSQTTSLCSQYVKLGFAQS